MPPAQHALALPIVSPGGGAAVRGLRLRQQSEIDEDLAGVDGEELRREAVVRADERGDVLLALRDLVEQVLRQPHHPVRTLVGGADVALAHVDEPVGGAVEQHVVVGRVGLAAGQRRRDETEELVLELVGRRVADEREVRFVGGDQVLEQRPVELSPSTGPARRRSAR